VSIGPKQAQETLRTALAMGCDRAIHITTDLRTDQELGPKGVAKLLAAVAEKESPDVVIVGKQAIDGDMGCTGSMLAAYMDVPQCTFAAKIDLDAKTVERETDAGTEVVSFPSLPAVFTADLRLNEPRYATLPNIMKAKKKKMDTIAAADLVADLTDGNTVLEVFEPAPRAAGVLVDDVDALVDKLKNEAAVI
jgi:electron transfer flavoprotein beta subunit